MSLNLRKSSKLFKYIYYLCLIFVFIIIITSITRHSVLEGKYSKNFIFKFIYTLSQIPSVSKNQIFDNNEKIKIKLWLNQGEFSYSHHTDKKLGFTFFKEKDQINEAFLLFSKYNQDTKKFDLSVFEVKEKKIIHTYNINIDKINNESNYNNEMSNLKIDNHSSRYGYFHPLLLKDGSVVFHSFSPLIKTDLCGNLIFQSDHYYNHAIEKSSDNTVWSNVNRYKEFNMTKITDNEITKVNLDDGSIIISKSILNLLLENNLTDLFMGAYVGTDPFHINDIQPVLQDGKYWMKGDVFLSLRSISTIILYRPSEDRIIWHKTGPWRHQHDVDIINENMIGVFNNGTSTNFKDSKSNILYYNFETNKTYSPFEKSFNNYKISTTTQGLFTITKNGNLFIDETERGRMLMIDSDGELVWEHISDTTIRWPRLIESKKIIDNIKKNTKNCDN